MNLSNIKILIVEDELLFAKDLRNQLTDKGYTVSDIATNGLDAIIKAESQNVNLILMDIRLKGKLDGIDTGKLLKQKIDIPIIYITALTDEKTKASANDIHPLAFITKPFDEVQLENAIEKLITHENSN